MNKIFWVWAIVVGVILFGVLVIGGGEYGKVTEKKDIEIVFEPDKSPSSALMKDFNGINYSVLCDDNNKNCVLTLNKNNVFSNREVAFSLTQNCLDWNKSFCLSYSETTCLEMEVRPTVKCLKFGEQSPIELPPSELPCIEYEQPIGCTEFDTNIGVCNKWDKELSCLKWSTPDCNSWSTPTCLTWTKYSKEDFTKIAIAKELEFISGINVLRDSRNVPVNDFEGKIFVK
jgi:hypothetical protein